MIILCGTLFASGVILINSYIRPNEVPTFFLRETIYCNKIFFCFSKINMFELIKLKNLSITTPLTIIISKKIIKVY